MIIPQTLVLILKVWGIPVIISMDIVLTQNELRVRVDGSSYRIGMATQMV